VPLNRSFYVRRKPWTVPYRRFFAASLLPYGSVLEKLTFAVAEDFTTTLKLLQHYPAVDFKPLLKVADGLRNQTVGSLAVRWRSLDSGS
jgi:hypothetical protein